MTSICLGRSKTETNERPNEPGGGEPASSHIDDGIHNCSSEMSVYGVDFDLLSDPFSRRLISSSSCLHALCIPYTREASKQANVRICG